MHPIHIEPAEPNDYEWCARLMAASEPWITLQRDFDGCRRVLNRPGTELFIARNQNSRAIHFARTLWSGGFAIYRLDRGIA